MQSAEPGTLVDQGRDELDMDKRKQIYDRIFSIVNTERYMVPVIPAPSLIVRHKDVTFDTAPIIYAQGFTFNQMGWVK